MSTGSGKTVLFELAIIRLLWTHNMLQNDFKAVYIAPIKVFFFVSTAGHVRELLQLELGTVRVNVWALQLSTKWKSRCALRTGSAVALSLRFERTCC